MGGPEAGGRGTGDAATEGVAGGGGSEEVAAPMSSHPYPPSHGPRAEAIDPDVDLHVPAQRLEVEGPRKGKVLAVIAVGGAIGASARYGVSLLWPSVWATFAVNVFGCLLIGVLMVLVSERGVVTRPLVRPFVGVGVLGGFTTFSTYALDFARLLERHRAGTALLYAAATLATALGAVWLGASVTRRLVDRREAGP